MKRTASAIRARKYDIMTIWEDKVKSQMKASDKNNKISLHDHVPNILEGIVIILERQINLDSIEKDPKYEEILHNSKEHGRHRATTEFYTIDEIVKEYILFHQVINEVLKEEGITNLEIYLKLNFLIENAILSSTVAFSEALQEIQEKLIGTLAHDLRNPLAAARMAIEMQQIDLDQERFAKVKKMIFNSVNKAIHMIEGFLENIHVKAGEGMQLKFSKSDILSEIKTICLEMKDIYNEEIVFNSNNLTSCEGIFDATAIRRLLENLINNALKYGDSHKPITISFEERQDNIALSVHNYGRPIEKELQHKIFNFLNYGKEVRKHKLQSWGMGLTLVKMVTEAHKGKIHLESEEKYGTKFEIILPKFANPIGNRRTKLNYEQNQF